MEKKLTVFQRLGRVLGNEASSPAYVIDPKSFDNLDQNELDQKKLEAQQTFYLQNQWKKIDNELYQKAVYYEPTRMASYFDYEAMEYCIAGDTKIATPEGFITIKELADKGRDHEFITYAYDHNLKKVVPAIARNAHYTRDEMTYKVIFDDGSYIITTWEHQLMKRDGSFERVMNLKPGESMMPFYRKSFYNNQKYNWVYTCNKDEGTNGWVAEHNLIAEWFYGNIGENEEVHHIDFNGKNNNPENLKIWDMSEHRAYHARLNNEKLWSNPDYRAKMLEISKRTDNKHKWNGERSGENNPAYFKIPFDLIIEAARIEKTLKKTAKALNISYRKIQRDIVNSGYRDWNTFILAYGIEKSKYSTSTAKGNQLQLNHKIVSIEPHGVIPVYDLTVPGYKNFATDTIFSHNTPEISVALDIFADEATTANESGKILSVYSESTRIKNELTNLFENVLDINTNLTSWARNLVKYGDNFVYTKIVPKKGVVGCTQLPNIELTRSEPGFVKVSSYDDYQDEKVTKFHWRDKNIDFNSFEVAHFRLLGDDRKLPYGTSLLEKVRRIWKQLLLSEDAMLVYRTTRAPERRVYKIFVGNMDDKDVDAYVDKIANNFKRTNVVNSQNGNQDTRYNPLAVDQDYFIPVRDPGLAMPIETLAGAQNLSEIADIEYIQKKMLAALRVPKAFLGFDESTGEGKNLAILDIRFARAVHRIQKALIQELNKIAIIHLYLKGYEDDLNNFTLSLTTPSTQADILKVQNWKEKIQLYRDAVSDAGNGYGAVSMTWAKKEILGMSEEEIKLDVQRQAVEKAGGEELKILAETIKQTGLFREIYKAYKINPENMTTAGAGGTTEPGSELDTAISGGGGGGVGMDFTTPLETPEAGGEESTMEPGAEGGVETTEPIEEPIENLAEITKKRIENRRGKINESLNKTIEEINKLIKD
jgi:hypothetical protein